MTTKYWIDGGDRYFTGNNNWSLSSGGPNNTTAPTVTDDVVFDTNSKNFIAMGTVSVRFNSIASCRNFTIDNVGVAVEFGYTSPGSEKFKIAGNIYIRNPGYTVKIYKDVYLENFVGGITFDADSSFAATATPPIYSWYLDHGTFTLLSDFNQLVRNFNVGLESTLDTNGFYFYPTSQLNLNYTPYPYSNPRVVNINSPELRAGSLIVGTNTTLNAATSKVIAGYIEAFQQVDLNEVQISSVRGESITFNFAKLTGSNFSCTGGTNNIVNVGTWDIPLHTVGNYAEVGRRFLHLNVSAITGSYSDLIFTDMTGSGVLSTTVGTRIGVNPRVNGILGSPSRNLYYSYAAGGSFTNSTSIPKYSNTSGGTPEAQYNVLPQDNVIIDDNSTNSGSTLTMGTFRGTNVDFSNRTLPVTISTPGNVAFTVYGNLTLSPAVTAIRTLPPGYVSVGDLFLYGDGEQQITSAGVPMPFTCAIYNPTGSIKLMDDCSFTSDTQFNLYAGDLYLNDNNLSVTVFRAVFNDDLKSLNFGAGTLTLVPRANGAIAFDFSSAAESTLTVTYSEGASLVVNNGTYSCTFEGDNLSYPPIELAGTGTVTIQGANTFSDISSTAPSSHTVIFEMDKTHSFDSFSLSGSVGKIVSIEASFGSYKATLKKHNAWFVGSNSIDAGGNSNLYYVNGNDGIDYLSFQNITGTVYVTGAATKNFFFFGA